jgi:hypothetical protein
MLLNLPRTLNARASIPESCSRVYCRISSTYFAGRTRMSMSFRATQNGWSLNYAYLI